MDRFHTSILQTSIHPGNVRALVEFTNAADKVGWVRVSGKATNKKVTATIASNNSYGVTWAKTAPFCKKKVEATERV